MKNGRAREERDLTPMADLLDEVVGGVLARAGGASGAVIFEEWKELAGTEWQHATPVRLSGNTLVVEVSRNAQATRLRYSTGALLERIAARVGEGRVAEVRVRIRRARGGS